MYKTMVDLTKPSDAFLGRKVYRKISIPISLLLAKTPVTPNQVTFFNIGISFVAAWLVSTGRYGEIALGGVLFQLGLILDGCDGELARLKNRFTRLGDILDKVNDRLAIVLFFAGAVVGVHRQGGLTPLLPLWIEGLVAMVCAMSLGPVLLMRYRRRAPPEIVRTYPGIVTYLKNSPFPIVSKYVRWMDPLVRREFLSLFFMILALINKLHWLLLTACFGANLAFFSVLFFMVWLALRVGNKTLKMTENP